MTRDPLADVYADPDSDEPRQRVAALGGPRGEFITTQLMRARGEKVPRDRAAAEKALLKQHAREWLEPYDEALVISSVKWERGFPVAGRLNLGGRWQKTRQALDRVPALATLKRLDLGAPNTILDPRVAQRLVLLPALRGLREIHALPRALLAQLAVTQPPFALETIHCAPQGGGGLEGERNEAQERATLDQALADGTGLPHLRDLTLQWSHGHDKPEDYAWLFQTPTGHHLKALRFACYYFGKTLPLWHAALTSAADNLQLETLEIHHGDWELFLERTQHGFTRLHGDLSRSPWDLPKTELENALATIGPALSQIEVKGRAQP